MSVFKINDIVKVLIPNVVNSGYDYRITASAALGQFVRVSVMNKPYVGVIVGGGDSGLGTEKIKSAEPIEGPALGIGDLEWIYKMSEWTMMPPGAVLRMIINVPDAFEAKGEKRKAKNEYEYFDTGNVKLNEEQVAAANAIKVSSPPLEGSGEAGGWFNQVRDSQKYYNLPFNENLTERAKELRKAGSLPEALFWPLDHPRGARGAEHSVLAVVGLQARI